MTRTSVIYGPAFITWNGATWFTAGDIVCKLGSERFRIPVSPFGNVSSRLSQRVLTISFTPCGEWENDTKVILFSNGANVPFADLRVGDSIVGPTDRDMVITPLNGKAPITLSNACLSKLPNLTWKATETIIGAVEFMVLGVQDTDWSVANSLFTIGADMDPSSISLAAFSLPNIITKGYQHDWNPGGSVTGFHTFEAKEGVAVDFGMEIEAFSIDSNGIIDYRLKGLDVKVTCQPVGPTEAQITTALALQGTGAARGHASNNIMADFIVQDGESSATVFTAKNMSLVEAELGWGQRSRIGQCTWESNRTVSGGSLTTAFVIA